MRQSLATSSSRPRWRPNKSNPAPKEANSSAPARPIPRVEPVIRTNLPFIEGGFEVISILIGRIWHLGRTGFIGQLPQPNYAYGED